MKAQVRRQRLTMMLYNLVAFTLIFALFGFILYSQIQSSLYEPVNEALTIEHEDIERDPEAWLERQLTLRDYFPRQQEERSGERGAYQQPPDGPNMEPRAEDGKPPAALTVGKAGTSMRVQTLLRDDTGAVINPQFLGHLYFFLEEIPLTGSGEIAEFHIGDAVFASVVFDVDAGGETYTVQLFTNVEGERAILDNFVRLLVLCVIVFVTLSLLASFLLSQKTMAPIIKSWNRQTEFVENASHELRTPLTIIQNKLESLLTQPQATVMERASEIGVSLAETRRLSKLTADLMTLARADSGETLLEKSPFPLDEMIAEVCEPYAELAEMQDKRMTLSLACERELSADKSRLHELMVILLDNALKYTREGDGISVRTSFTDGRIVIEVADSGIGIPEEHARRVFDRFYRADKARSREQGGSGLGLSIAKWIVDAHGGTICAVRAPEGGAAIQVRLKP